MPSQRRMLTVAAVAAAAVALGFWWIRDLPRQRVEKALTQRLGRPVTVAKLRVAAPDRFRLEGVAAAGVAGMPWLGRVRLEDVEIEGGARDLLAGRIDALRIHGGSVHLVQPPWPEEEPLPPSELEVGRLEVERLEVLVPAATETEPPARLTLAGSMEHFRGALDEQLELTFHGTAERFELAPVAAFALALANPLAPGAAPGGALEDLQLELRWPGASGAAPSPGPRLELDLTARGGEVLTTAGRAVLDSPAIHATTDAAMRSASASWTAGSVRLEPRDRPAQTLTSPSLELVYASDPDADQAPASLEVDTQLAPLLPKAHAALGWRSGALSTVDATTADIELASLLPWLGLPPEVELAGRGRLSITTSEGVVAGTVELDLPRVVAKLAAGTIEAREASVSLETTWSLTEESKLLELAGRLRTGNLTLPGPGAAPARLDDARLEADARLVPDRWSELPNGPLGPDALLRLLEGPLSVRADLPRGTAGAKGDLLAGALPVRLEATLTASDAPKDPDTSPARLEVHARTASLGAGRISGPVLPGAPATGWDWQWSWSLPDLAPAFDTARTWAAGAGAELPEDLRVGGAAKARGTLRGGLDAPRLSASLELEGASIGVADQALDAIEGSLRVRWPVAGNNRQHRSALAVDRISLAARARPSGLAELPLELEGSGSWGGERTEIGSLKLSTETQGTLEVSGWLAPPAAELDLELRGAGLGEWRDYLRPWTGEIGSELEADGAAAAMLHLASDASAAWTADGSSEITGTGFTSIDGSRVLQGLGSRWTVHADGRPDSPIAFRGEGSVDGFQLLWDTFFGDFTPLETRVAMDGTFEPAAPEGSPPSFALHGTWSLPEGRLAEATLRSRAEGGADYQAEVRFDDLSETFARHIHGPLVDAAPELADLAASGALRIRAQGAIGDQGTTLAAEVSAAGLGIEHPAIELGVHDLFLELPLALDIDADGTLHAGQVDERGRLGYSSITFRGLELPAVDTELAVRGERIELEKPVDVPLLGGHVVLEKLALRRLLQPDRAYECALRIDGIELARLGEGLGLFPLDGSVEAYLPQVRLQGDRLEISGGGRAELFGGSVEVSDLAAEKLFDPFPRFRFSARFEDIDLEKLTGQLDFGEMTGLVEGYLKDVEVVGTSPVRFEALIRSPTKRQKHRVVSVRAINNIAILGTGAGTNILDRGIHKLFDRYTYGALGISMSLSGDAFRLRGLEHRGDRELFLRGRLPFPIDVVNAQPGGSVSFQTMVRRLRSLDVSKATTGRAPQ